MLYAVELDRDTQQRNQNFLEQVEYLEVLLQVGIIGLVNEDNNLAFNGAIGVIWDKWSETGDAHGTIISMMHYKPLFFSIFSIFSIFFICHFYIFFMNLHHQIYKTPSIFARNSNCYFQQ